MIPVTGDHKSPEPEKQPGISRNLNVNDAQNIQRQTNHTIIIVLAINPETGLLEYSSYGKDKIMCNIATVIADGVFGYVEKLLEDAGRIIRGKTETLPERR